MTSLRSAQRAYDNESPPEYPEPVELPAGRGDPLTALKWCRARLYCRARYIATRTRAMRRVVLPGGRP